MINPVEIGNSIAKQILFESDDTKKVVIYSGRFQPFHEGHYLTYSHLVKKFGKDNVFIGTPDKVEKPKSPLNFKEKVKVMTTMFGIPRNRIFEIKNLDNPKEIPYKLSTDTTFVVTIDENTTNLNKNYFQKYEDSVDFLCYIDRGYVYTPPSLSTLSGKQVRSMLGDPSLFEDERKLNFKKIYGKFNQSIFDLVAGKLTECVVNEWLIDRGGKLFEGSVSSIGPDDGPAFVYPNFAAYKGATKRDLKRFLETGWNIVKYMVDDSQEREFNPPIYPNGPVDSVSFFPAGDLGNVTPNNQRDIYGVKAYDTWKKHILNIIKTIGWEYIESRQQQRLMKKLSGDSAKDIKGNINESFDRLGFYEEYFKNVAPNGFNVKRRDDKILIQLSNLNEDKTLNQIDEEFIDDLTSRVEEKRKERSKSLSSKFLKIQHRIGGRGKRIRTLFFETPSQSGNNKWIQRVRLPDYSQISRLKKNLTFEDKVKMAVNAGEVEVHCNCPDFLYKGYEWMADAGDYGIDKQDIPPNVRNPELEGSVCKHLNSVLDNIDSFMPKIISDWKKYNKLVRQKKR